MSNVLELKDKIGRWLAEDAGNVALAPDGAWTVRNGSARIFVQVREWGEDSSTVSVVAPLLFDAPPSPELYRHIALHADDYLFGHLSAVEQDGTVSVFFTHVLLGDYLDPDELLHAVRGVAFTGDEIDTQLQERFGGRTFHEDAAPE